MRTGILSIIICATLTAGIAAQTIYVAADGNDSNTGDIASPLATIQQAQNLAAAGDTVYIRGGTYIMEESLIARYESIWAKVTYLDKSGTEDNPIKYWAYPGEEPVFDYQNIKPQGYRVHAFAVAGSWIHIKGITVTGVQVTILDHTQSVCFYNTGSNNTYEQLVMRDGQAIGIYAIKHGANNLFLNCDAYNNWDYTSEGGVGGNVDGFGVHVYAGATGNVFDGCRAWFNSDDGYDCINTAEPAVFRNCWSMYNGYTPDFTPRGDGNGFKVGGYAYTPAESLPVPIPRHTTTRCIAVRNKANGFYANHQVGGNDWLFNSAYRNAANFNMLSRLADPAEDTAGYEHYLEGNLAYVSNGITNINTSLCTLINNTFDDSFSGEVLQSSFMSLDESQLTASRHPNGTLPEITFLRPAPGSGLLNTGYFAGLRTNGDINYDGFVDGADFVILADEWLSESASLNADVAPADGDGEVNLLDYALLAGNWPADQYTSQQAVLLENSFGNTDNDTGIDTSVLYTHKVDLIADAPAEINGVVFDAGGTGSNPALGYNLSGPVTTRTAMDSPAAPDSGLWHLLSNFVYKGNDGNHSLTLSGLTGGATYKLRLYVGGYSGRTFTLSCENPAFSRELLDRGLGDSSSCGSFDFTYTLESDRNDITVNIVADDPDNVFHWYAFTNELVSTEV